MKKSNTTNEEKAREIAEWLVEGEFSESTSLYIAVMSMARWKDKQFAEMKHQLIDKAGEWLNNNTISTTPFVYTFTASRDNIDKKTFIEQFKHVMED